MSNIYKKDGKTYIFSSKFEIFNYAYSISPKDKKIVKNNLDDSIEYLKKSYIEINDDKISLYEISPLANIQPKKYRAELWNRVNTIKDIAKDKGFDTPVFITLTPPSYLKPLKQIRLGKTNSYKLVDNPKFSGSLDFVKESRDFITTVWRKFLTQQIFKDIRKEFNSSMMYLRVNEPFIDGSCHSHIVAFIPAKYKDRFVKLVKGYFKTKTDIKTEFNGDIGGVVAYLLKYALKSFRNGISGELADTTYWYIFYNIRRFSTSRTLLPMYIFRKINSFDEFRDLKKMTHLYKNGMIEFEVIQNTEKYLSGSKMLSTDYKIDTIIIKVDGFYETIHHIAYQRNYNLKVVFPDREVGLNGEQAKIKSLVPLLKSFSKRKQEEDKNLFLASWKLKPFAHMTNYQLVTHYVQSFFWYTYPIKIASLENELLKRGFGYLTGEKEKHCLNLWNYRNLANKFGNKGLIPLPF